MASRSAGFAILRISRPSMWGIWPKVLGVRQEGVAGIFHQKDAFRVLNTALLLGFVWFALDAARPYWERTPRRA